jgi:cysteine synthase
MSILGVESVRERGITGLKNMSEAIVPGIFKPDVLDHRTVILDEEAYKTSKRPARDEGIFSGMSSGTALKTVLDLTKELNSGTIVALLPDRRERYVTTVLYCIERCTTALCTDEHCGECRNMVASP